MDNIWDCDGYVRKCVYSLETSTKLLKESTIRIQRVEHLREGSCGKGLKL
jgi:hypothetical protein